MRVQIAKLILICSMQIWQFASQHLFYGRKQMLTVVKFVFQFKSRLFNTIKKQISMNVLIIRDISIPFEKAHKTRLHIREKKWNWKMRYCVSYSMRSWMVASLRFTFPYKSKRRVARSYNLILAFDWVQRKRDSRSDNWLRSSWSLLISNWNHGCDYRCLL